MGGRIFMTSAWRQGLALTLFMLAIALKIVVPAGFMAEASSGSPFALVLCSDQGPVEAAQSPVGPDTEHPSPQEHDDQAPCAFTGHGASSLLVDTQTVRDSQSVDYAALTPPERLDAGVSRSLAAPPPPARGPPRLT
jgi:hypothetical protein